MEISIRNSPQLDDIRDMFHRIQSLLPIKDAACTSVLSKSWQQAWSTMPNLKFSESDMLSSQQHESEYVNLINQIMQRYLLHDISIESFDLEISVKNQESASLVEKWIRLVASQRCFKALSLSILEKIDSFTFPSEIFSAKNLETIRVAVDYERINPLSMSGNSSISCISLRELELAHMNIREDLLNTLLTICKLLEKIHITFHNVVKKIKVRNLHRLHELKITSAEKINLLEIDDVPSLRVFLYDSVPLWSNQIPFNTDSLKKVTELWLGGVIMFATFFDMIKLKFPFLESLAVRTGCSSKERFDITFDSLKRLNLSLSGWEQVHIQVYAPKLLFFHCESHTVPILSFTTGSPKQIELKLALRDHIDCLFFVNLSKILALSSKFDIEIESAYALVPVQSYINFDDLRRISFPITNIQRLSLDLHSGKYLRQHLQILYAFMLTCHPSHIVGYRDEPFKDNKLYKKIVRWMVKKKMPDLIYVKIENPRNFQWETLTSSWKSYPIGDWNFIEFKLNWRSR